MSNNLVKKAAFWLYNLGWALAIPSLRLNHRLAEGFEERTLKRKVPSAADLGFSALYRLCLINEHDGYIIPNFVKELALVTNKSVFGLIQIDIPFALRACQNVQ
jgi:3-deoxy-D-manno-octulosonic-acid transferase